MSSYSFIPKSFYTSSLTKVPIPYFSHKPIPQSWLVLAIASFLVSIPVFFQAPLVRLFPWISLWTTLAWLGLSIWLYWRPKTQFLGDLLIGFTWTWLAGSIYWGWLRWEPYLHLPIEAIGLPIALICLKRQHTKVGSLFYLGSLFGTTMTDLYFYLVDLIPHWRQLMRVEPASIHLVFQSALSQMQTSWGIGCAIFVVITLLLVGYLPLRCQQLHWWAFGGAVLTTVPVDGLFWLAAGLS